MTHQAVADHFNVSRITIPRLMRLRNVYLADVSNISIDNDDVNISSSSSISFFSKYLWVESLSGNWLIPSLYILFSLKTHINIYLQQLTTPH